MLLFPVDPEGGDARGPDEGEPSEDRGRVPSAEELAGEQPQSRPSAVPPPLPPTGPLSPPDDLPSYPRDPGQRARQARGRERIRPALPDDEHGLPTYPRSRRPERRRPLADRVLVLIVALGAVLLIAYAITQADREPEPDNALAQAASAFGTTEIAVPTRSPARARQFVRDEFGWGVGVPIFGDATLEGVGIAALAPSIEVPAFFYSDERGREATVFALSYALLDQVPDRIRLSRADFERLADDPAPRIHRISGRDVVLWRDRADIFVLVTDIPPSDVLRGIRVAR